MLPIHNHSAHTHTRTLTHSYSSAPFTSHKWKAAVNKTINIKLGHLNLHYQLLINQFNGVHVPDKTKENRVLSRSDKTMLSDYEQFKKNPAKFGELDSEIEQILLQNDLNDPPA